MTSARSEYKAAHARVVDAHGPAILHPCDFCGRGATEHAYDHQDPAEIFRDGFLWSESTAHYRPLCVRCHRAYDRAFRKHGKTALPAVAEALREAAGEFYEGRRKAFEATADSAWRAYERAIAGRKERRSAAETAAAKIAGELMSRAYAKRPSGISPEELRASWVRWAGDHPA